MSGGFDHIHMWGMSSEPRKYTPIPAAQVSVAPKYVGAMGMTLIMCVGCTCSDVTRLCQFSISEYITGVRGMLLVKLKEYWICQKIPLPNKITTTRMQRLPSSHLHQRALVWGLVISKRLSTDCTFAR